MNANLKIPYPLDRLKIPDVPTAPAPAADGPPTREDVLAALETLQERGPKIAPRRGDGHRVQYRLRPREAQLVKTTEIALSIIAGRPITQALALRVAMLRLASATSAALRDGAVASVLRSDIQNAREAALEP